MMSKRFLVLSSTCLMLFAAGYVFRGLGSSEINLVSGAHAQD